MSIIIRRCDDGRPASPAETLHAAETYWHTKTSPLAIPFKEDRPRANERHPSRRRRINYLWKIFGERELNIGLWLGRRSGGLVDVSLLCAEAEEMAPDFLPATPLRSRRTSPGSSQLFYKCLAMPTRYYYDDNRKPTLEVRGEGQFSLVSPSMHPSGELIYWEEFGLPFEVAVDDLFEGVKELAEACRRARIK